MEIEQKYERIKTLYWQYRQVPVRVRLGSDGKPEGKPCVLISDMENDFLEALERWRSEVCLFRAREIISYDVTTIERFLAWDRDMRGGADRY